MCIKVICPDMPVTPCMNERQAFQARIFIEDVAGGKAVQAVDHDVSVDRHFSYILFAYLIPQCFHQRINARDGFTGRKGFILADVRIAVENLAVEIG